MICLKDKNYNLHLKNFYVNNKKSILLYIIFVIYLFIQILPMPINFLKFISPEKFKFISSLENISYSSISLSPSNTYFQILNFASLLLIVFICKMIFYNKRHKYRFYYYLSLTGFIASVVAILFYLNGNPDILIFKNSHYKNSSTGFFINRTALAVFLIFCLIASFELLKNYEDNKKIKKNDYFFIKIYVRLFIVFISIGIITSFSRIGNFLLLITILLYLFNEIFYVKRKDYTFRVIILVIILFDILILGIYFGSSEIINRFYFLKEEFITISGEISTTTRFDIIKFGISELNNFIFFGYGAGGFENLFKLKFINTSSQFANHSHADIIEFLGEFGLIGFLLFLSSFLKFFLRNQNYSFVSILLISYLIIILAFDFTLHIPIIQILFVIFFIFNKKLFS
tara:strand:- start:92 stop:1291 length:1200 start_codon:yes stop_codon:yes gene_type:complete